MTLPPVTLPLGRTVRYQHGRGMTKVPEPTGTFRVLAARALDTILGFLIGPAESEPPPDPELVGCCAFKVPSITCLTPLPPTHPTVHNPIFVSGGISWPTTTIPSSRTVSAGI